MSYAAVYTCCYIQSLISFSIITSVYVTVCISVVYGVHVIVMLCRSCVMYFVCFVKDLIWWDVSLGHVFVWCSCYELCDGDVCNWRCVWCL